MDARCSIVFPMNLMESFRSKANLVLWKTRGALRFKRPGYKESPDSATVPQGESLIIDQKYNFAPYREKLLTLTSARNLSTLWYLDHMLKDISWPSSLTLVEPGCQDFARLPAWRSFFKKQNVQAHIHGIEVDPFPVLSNLHSRWDKAQYYISLEKDGAHYEAGDFFKYPHQADVIFCFYPFVSKNPALAWGLPAEFASPQKWIESFVRVLKPGGYVLVGHQGDWEERSFDQAREQLQPPLELLKREVLNCPFFPPQYPFHLSLYKRK